MHDEAPLLSEEETSYDVSSIFELVNYNTTELREILSILLKNIDEYQLLYEEGLAEKDFEKMIMATHTLKGDMDNIKAEALRKEAMKLEFLAKNRNCVSASEEFPQFKQKLQILKSKIMAEWKI